MPQFIKVATTDALADQQAKLVEVEGQKIALFRVDGGFYALSEVRPQDRGRPRTARWAGHPKLPGEGHRPRH
jgi:nitrite reductase/ring-hydroxylating ferredoxin subunit